MKYVSEWTAQDEADYQRTKKYTEINTELVDKGMSPEDADAAARHYDMLIHGEGDVSLDELMTGIPAQK